MGFGASPQDLQFWSGMDPSAVINRLLNYEDQPANIDARIGEPAFVNVGTQPGRPFSPNTLINDARQRWLFRMIHSQRPLEEKIAAMRTFETHVVPLLARGAVKPIVDCVMPLADAARAHERMASNAGFGKIVLTC